MDTPLPHRVAAAFQELAAAREKLLAEGLDPDDALLWQDMLEGESAMADPFAAVDYLMGVIVDAELMAEAVRTRRTELAERLARFTARAERWRTLAQEFLTALDVKRLERPTYTASIGAGRAHVIPTAEPEDLPRRFQRVAITANKDALAAALKAGEEVPAVWSNPGPQLSIRTR